MIKRFLTFSIVVLCAIALLLGAAYFVGSKSAPEISSNPAPLPVRPETQKVEVLNKATSTAPASQIKGTLIVNGLRFESSVDNGKTAYDLMEAARSQGLSFESAYYSGLGFFITSIKGVPNAPQEGKYWTLYVNGERSNVGASNYQLKPEDSIEWRLEKN